jgi:hypothetical protein
MSGVAHAAPGLVAAIQFQLKRALVLLLSSDADCSVAIEAPWDVSVVAKDGDLIRAEENKNSIRGVSQLTNRHESWWKSLRNFTAAFVDGRLDGDSCKLVICTNTAVNGGNAANFKGRSWDENDEWIAAQVAAIRTSGRKPTETIAAHVSFIEQHLEQFTSVIRNLEVIDASAENETPKTTQEIFRLLRSTSEEQQFVLEALLGWIGERVEAHVNNDEPAIIPVSAFNIRYRDELNRGRQLRLLRRLDADFASNVTPERKRQHEGDMFQKQLHWVGFERSPEVLEQAMNDYLKYEVAVTAYAEVGEIPKTRFDQRDTEIFDQWKTHFLRETFGAINATPDLKKDMGRKVYFACAALNVPVEGVGQCDSYLTRGALQHLANAPADKPKVGWHPEFQTLAAINGSAPR